MNVAFILHGEPQLEALNRLDPDRDWRELVVGERAWILQTYLRMRAAGHAVSLQTDLPHEGIAVFSSKQRHILRRTARNSTRAILVGVREDVGETLIADFEVVQNKHQADTRRRFFIPLWPQPNLLPRIPGRGTRIENIAFKGFLGNLHAEFQTETWRAQLGARGVRFLCDATPYLKQATDSRTLAWNDFREVDLILAVRPHDPRLHPRKPATKLYNAWHAGVPAILGPEIAYRELRRSELDYFEVSSVAEAMQAVERLVREPARYVAMVENGRRRAAEFTPDAIRLCWTDLLFRNIPERAHDSHVRRWQALPLWLKSATRRVTRVFRQ